MAEFIIDSVAIKGMASAVPKNSVSNRDYSFISEKERELLIKTTGVESRRIAPPDMSTSDLFFEAANRLIKKLEWNKDEIELLVVVSQSRDYILPSTAIILQDRLGLSKSCLAFDVPLGCSGYVYGISIVSAMLQSAKIKKALLLAGDISTLSLNERDKSTYPLFGDAGTATAFEYDLQAKPFYFSLGSDGKRFDAIIIKDGGVRSAYSASSEIEEEIESGINRSPKNLALKGLDVFNFSVSEVPPLVNHLLNNFQIKQSDIDYFVFHQANKLMNETIRKKLKIEEDNYPYSLNDFGNTSSASIPLTCCTQLSQKLSNQSVKQLWCGFGVGLSWATVILDTKNLVIPELIEL